MRIPDRILQESFMYNLTNTKQYMNKIQEKLVTQSKINRPSDNPLGNSRIMKLSTQIDNIQVYNSNIETSLSKVGNTITAMEGIHTELQNILTRLTAVMNPTIGDNIEAAGVNIDLALKSIIDLANSEFNGEYLFGGTDMSTEPFTYKNDGTGVQFNIDDMSGEQKIRLTNNVMQKINMNGRDLFQPVLNLGGNLDSTQAVGNAASVSRTVWDADGNKYTMDIVYTKTAANTYDMDMTITDSSSVTVYNDSKELIFNSSSGQLQSIDGGTPEDLRIEVPSNKIDFIVDTNAVIENSSTASLRSDLTQNADVFNTLFSIKEKLLAGELPSADQVDIVKKFESHILNQISEMGNVSKRLTDTQEMLSTQQLDLQRLLASEKDVDVASAVIEMQNYDYSLQMAYKVSAMILPKSLLEYI